MTQRGEAAYVPPNNDKKPEDPKNKDGLTIRIILLCDGTNNNKNNIAVRETFENWKGAEPESESNVHKEFGTVGSSYDNGRTNIATMEPHVEVGEGVSGYSIVVKVYVQGQGTFNYNEDSELIGKGLAVFSSGVYQRAREGINDALALLQEEFLNTEKHSPDLFFIRQVDVDVFGFSRGAATARHAIHVITTEETIMVADPSGYGARTIITNQPLHDRLRLRGYSEMRKDQVKIIFAGLYDTVVSVNASQLLPAFIANNTLSQRAVEQAKFTLHLAAADEHRKDFPLHRITSATKVGRGAEYFLPGVHSDIGGSYNLANEALLVDGKEKNNAEIREVKCEGSYEDCDKKYEELMKEGYSEGDLYIYPITNKWLFSDTYRLHAYRNIDGLEYARPSDEVDRVINRGKVSDLQEDMKHLMEDGWYNNDDVNNPQIRIETNYVATFARALLTSPILLQSPKAGKIIVNRRRINSSYCTLPLKFMVKHSRKQAIKIDEKLDKRIKTILDKVPEFKTLEERLQLYMDAMGPTGSHPSDWNNIKSARSIYSDIKKLRNEHLHMSSRWDPSGVMTVLAPVADFGFTPRFEGNLRRRFYYEG